jgi:hypothetical protein
MKASQFLSRIALVLVIGVTLEGCATTQLRQAQAHFSNGASAENAATLSGYRLGASESTRIAATGEYREAYLIATDYLRAPSRSLEGDDLIGTARMLQVYSLWRVLALDRGFAPSEVAARSTDSGGQQDALTESALRRLVSALQDDAAAGKVHIGARDRAMLAAMPALIDHERGLSARTYPEAERRFFSAYCTIGRIAGDGPADHGVGTYLRLAQMQSLSAWHGAATTFKLTNAQRDRLGTILREAAAAPVCGLRGDVEAGALDNGSGVLVAQLGALGISYNSLIKKCPAALPAMCTGGLPVLDAPPIRP